MKISYPLQQPEKAWIEGSIRNERKAQFRLYEWCFPHLMKVASRYCRNKDDAKAQTNAAFLKMIQSLTTYDPSREFLPWLRTIAIRLAIDAHRKESRYLLDFQSEEWDAQNEPEIPAEIVAEIDIEQIEYALQTLPDTERLVFNLHIMEDYGHQEIAEKLGMSERSSKRILQRAKLLLQEQLSEYGKTPRAI